MEPRTVPLEDEIQQPRFPSLLEKTLVNLLFTGSWFQHLENGHKKRWDLTLTQYNILRILNGQHGTGISIGAVRERMLERNPDLTRTLDRLVRKGLIRREVCPGDRRQAELYLTPQGATLLAEVDTSLAHLSPGLRALSDTEMVTLNTLLDKARAR